MAAKSVVLGASGFIGRHLVRVLDEGGASVRALVRSEMDGFPEGVDCVADSFDTPVDFDRALEGLDVLVHVAASNTVTTSHSAPLRELDGDLRTSLALLDALQRRSNIHLVFVSSGGTVYGDGPVDEPIRENARRHPRSFHGASKGAAELFFQAWAATTDNDLTIIRPANVYGPGQHPRRGFGVIPALFDSIVRDRVFRIRGSSRSTRDYLYVEDFADLIRRVVLAGSPPDARIVNASSGRGIDLAELIALVEKVTGKTVSTTESDSLSGDVNAIVLDPTRAGDLFHWVPTTSLERGLERTWAWFCAQGSGSGL